MTGWSGRRVLIIGVARQGTALARYLVGKGAQVVLNDRRPAEMLPREIKDLAELEPELTWALGDHSLDLLADIDLVCPSGGVPLTLPLVVEAVRRGIPLSNDSQIFLEAAPCRVIGITGSAGKTTTTTLVGRIADEAVQLVNDEWQAEGIDNPSSRLPLPVRYSKVWVGGNIGAPLIAQVDAMRPDDLAVMELSSFQLEIMTRSPQIAAVLNITPNHLDRHGTMAAYTAAKAHILAHQGPAHVAVLSRDDPGSWGLRDRVVGRLITFGEWQIPADQEGVYARGNSFILRIKKTEDAVPVETELLSGADIRLRGRHNRYNVLAACAIAAAAGLPAAAMQRAVAAFTGVAHRLEFVRRWGGADWYNDSIATAPERAMAAIHSFDEPLVLLAGGRDKDLPWEGFARLAHERGIRLVMFGEAADKIAAACEKVASEAGDKNGAIGLVRCKNLKDAVQAAARSVRPGDVVLLSPGGTSYDEFKDFEERGACFAQWVNELPVDELQRK